MIAAIYARKSTGQNGIGDEAKSVARQIEHSRAYAERKGWTVAGEHIYTDDGISGAEFKKRPGFLRLLNALAPRAQFQVLIMSEESRLGRESIETGWTLKKIIDAGVRIFYYLDDRERTLSSAIEKVMMHMSTFAAEMEREKAVQRTRDAMERKARGGHVASGRVYGYRNVRVNGHVEREIIPEQAAIICRIFEEIARGRGFARVAQGLNAEGIPSPTGRGWAMTGVRELVYRDLYRGRIVWGKTRWVEKGGRPHVKQDRPASEWLTLDAPALRIVSEEQWQAAHARLERTRQTYVLRTGGRLYGRPESGIESRYLLTGFLTCEPRQGGMSASWRSGERGGRISYYRCNTHRGRPGMCDNALTVRTAELETDVLTTLRQKVLVLDIVEAVVVRAHELYASQPDAVEDRRRRLTAEAQRLQGEIARFTDAIRLGGPLASLVEALSAAERQRAAVLAQLEHLDGLSRAVPWSADVRGEVRRRLDDWLKLIERQPIEARQVLRKVLPSRLVMTPKVTAGERWYEYAGPASYGGLLAGVLRVQGLVPPEGNHGPWTVPIRCVARAA